MPPSTPSNHDGQPAVDPDVQALAHDDSPDDPFAIVAGLTLALVLSLSGTAVLTTLTNDAATLYGGFVAVTFSLTVAGAAVVRQSPALPQRLGATRWRWLPAVAPSLVAALVLLTLYLTQQPATVHLILVAAAAVVGVAGGGVLGLMARTRYTKAVVEQFDQRVTWRAGWPDSRRRTFQLLGATAILVGLGAFVASVFVDYWLLRAVAQFLIPAAAGVATFGQPRRYSASPAGLEIRRPAARAIADWGRFDGYALTDDALVVHRRAPWRLPLVFDRSELDDEEAVIETIGEHLPRLPAA